MASTVSMLTRIYILLSIIDGCVFGCEQLMFEQNPNLPHGRINFNKNEKVDLGCKFYKKPDGCKVHFYILKEAGSKRYCEYLPGTNNPVKNTKPTGVECTFAFIAVMVTFKKATEKQEGTYTCVIQATNKTSKPIISKKRILKMNQKQTTTKTQTTTNRVPSTASRNQPTTKKTPTQTTFSTNSTTPAASNGVFVSLLVSLIVLPFVLAAIGVGVLVLKRRMSRGAPRAANTGPSAAISATPAANTGTPAAKTEKPGSNVGTKESSIQKRPEDERKSVGTKSATKKVEKSNKTDARSQSEIDSVAAPKRKKKTTNV